MAETYKEDIRDPKVLGSSRRRYDVPETATQGQAHPTVVEAVKSLNENISKAHEALLSIQVVSSELSELGSLTEENKEEVLMVINGTRWSLYSRRRLIRKNIKKLQDHFSKVTNAVRIMRRNASEGKSSNAYRNILTHWNDYKLSVFLNCLIRLLSYSDGAIRKNINTNSYNIATSEFAQFHKRVISFTETAKRVMIDAQALAKQYKI